jgi:LacI family transcriptional regulator
MDSNRPSIAYRRLPKDRRTVGLAFYGENERHLQGIFDHARVRGWHLLDLRYYNMKLPRTFRPDGVIFHLPAEYAPLVRQFLRMGVPVVQIEDHVLPRRCSCVVLDRQAIGQAAAEHFAARGIGNVAYLRSEIYDYSPERLTGQSFVNHAKRFGAKADTFALQRHDRLIPWTRFDTLVRLFREEIAKRELPLGILTYDDIMAGRICHFCAALGLNVPEQVAVLGIGNVPARCECSWVPLSSVDPNHFAQAQAAAELLDRLMQGEPAPKQHILIPPSAVVTRQSTDVISMPSLDMAIAMQYIRNHHNRPIQVPDIAAAAGITRRKLERHFRTHLHRSVNEELTRTRVEHSCQLLIATQLTLEDVAIQAGFNTPKYFYKVFGKAMGMTPGDYRKAHIAKLREPDSPEPQNEQQSPEPQNEHESPETQNQQQSPATQNQQESPETQSQQEGPEPQSQQESPETQNQQEGPETQSQQ